MKSKREEIHFGSPLELELEHINPDASSGVPDSVLKKFMVEMERLNSSQSN